jgi:hypothetical protein
MVFGPVIAFVMSFGSDLMTMMCSKLFSNCSLNIGMALHQCWASRSQHYNHLADPYGGYSMVWRQLIWFCDCLCHEFWFRFDDKCQVFSQLLFKYWHRLTQMNQQDPELRFNINYQTHMEDIQWSGGN